MPCHDDRDSWEVREAEQKAVIAHIDNLTDMLCRLIRVIESDELRGEPILIPLDIYAWWEKHREFDKKEGRR